MPATQAQKDALAANTIWPCDLWRMTAADGAVAAYASHTRHVTFDGTLYRASPCEPSTSVIQLGLEPDTSDFTGVFDDVVTRADVEGGRWRDAEIVKEILIDYRDPALGTVRRQKGRVGRIKPAGLFYTAEFRSLTDRLSQKIGDLTSNSDRARTLEELGVDPMPFTHDTAIMTATNRRKFKVAFVQPAANYFQNGRAEFLSGANAGQRAEIKDSVTTDGGARTEIELQLEVRSAIAAGATVRLIRGYKGTREDAKAIGGDAILNTRAEFDLPPWGFTLRYPE